LQSQLASLKRRGRVRDTQPSRAATAHRQLDETFKLPGALCLVAINPGRMTI
jgi:hypothetical protein